MRPGMAAVLSIEGDVVATRKCLLMPNLVPGNVPPNYGVVSSSGGAPKAKQGAARVTVLKAPLVGYFDTQNEHWEGSHNYNDSTPMTSAVTSTSRTMGFVQRNVSVSSIVAYTDLL